VYVGTFVSDLSRARERRSARALAVRSLGPLTVVAGIVWAVLQPWRITLLHPRGQSFWWLVIEPPILVVLAGLFFAWKIAPGLLDDLADAEEEVG
jgi:hypothetical protein